jgi:hypothetical protein
VHIRTASGAAPGAMIGALLDEGTFVSATTRPRVFQQSWTAMGNRLKLKAYAVAILAVNE